MIALSLVFSYTSRTACKIRIESADLSTLMICSLSIFKSF
jgi:hypothetical protein